MATWKRNLGWTMGHDSGSRGLSWAVVGIGLTIELLIGLGGWTAGWMLLPEEAGRNVNLVSKILESATPVYLSLGALLGAAVAVVLWLAIRIVKPLQRSRALKILAILGETGWMQVILLCLVAGIAEEILFRGCLQVVTNIWVAAVLFGLLHAYGRLYVVVAILAGAGLGYLYYFTGSLAAAAAAHAVYNLTVVVLVKLGLFPLPRAEEYHPGTGEELGYSSQLPPE